MESPEYVQTKLKLQTGATGVSVDVVDGERLEYTLLFDDTVGLDWLSSELGKAFAQLSVGMQRWKIEPHEDGIFGVTVRETDRREDLESDQQSLYEWE